MKTLIAHFLERHGSRRAFVGSLGALGVTTAGLGARGGIGRPAAAAQGSTSQSADSTYLFAHITLKPGMVEKFTQTLGEAARLFEKHGGWKLQGCYLQADGARTTVVDVWEIPGADSVQTTLAAAPADPAFQQLLPRIQECVESETLQVMTKQPVMTA
jgi:hypothetical protein